MAAARFDLSLFREAAEPGNSRPPNLASRREQPRQPAKPGGARQPDNTTPPSLASPRLAKQDTPQRISACPTTQVGSRRQRNSTHSYRTERASPTHNAAPARLASPRLAKQDTSHRVSACLDNARWLTPARNPTHSDRPIEPPTTQRRPAPPREATHPTTHRHWASETEPSSPLPLGSPPHKPHLPPQQKRNGPSQLRKTSHPLPFPSRLPDKKPQRGSGLVVKVLFPALTTSPEP